MNKILSEHPVASAVREEVLRELVAIEKKYGVHILFACESGSRGWGFASPDSDYDVRFIYVKPISWYASVEPGRDVIERPISDVLDISGWELRKALRLLRRSNPALFEWVDSPIIYRQDEAFVRNLRDLMGGHFSERRARHHYRAMAKKNFRGYLQGEEVRLKKYLYVLRPLLAAQWIEKGLGMPPTRFAELVDKMVSEECLRDEINALLAIKMRAGEAEYSPPWPYIRAFIETELEKEEVPADYKKPKGKLEDLDRLLLETVFDFSKKEKCHDND